MIKNTMAVKLGISEETTKHIATAWNNMKARCYNKKHPEYEKYGARGITVCEEWMKKSLPFIKWSLTNGYSKELEIDRENNDGNYEPSNCRWATRSTQVCNTRKLFNHNTTGYRGVSESSGGKYRASITLNSKFYHLGVYKTKVHAAKAYDSFIKVNSTEHTSNDLLAEDELIDYEKHMLVNEKNKSGYLGVSFRKDRKKQWVVRIYIDGKYKSLGHFYTELEAAQVREKFIIENKLQEKHKLNGVLWNMN